MVFVIASDPPGAMKKFENKLKATFPLLSDVNKNIANCFGVIGEKKLYDKNYQGTLRTKCVLDENNVITNIFEKVSPIKHQDEIFNVLGINGR